MIEAIAVEREMNGIPVGRIPSEYLADSATAAQQGFTNAFKKILRDVKFNDQGFILIPSDVYENDDGTKTSIPMVEFDLVTAKGTRAIPTGEVILRHQQNIARSVLADFLMLGSGDKGSFALSRSKTDLFLTAAGGFTEAIASVLNRQLMPRLWEINGFDPELMPMIAFGEIAPVDLAELGAFVRDIAGAGMPIFPDDDTENTLRRAAGFPEKSVDPDLLGTQVKPIDEEVAE
jgi:phage gp29-like protein